MAELGWETGPEHWQALAERQDGVLTREQARRGGMSEEQWTWKFNSGRWQPLLQGIGVAHSGPVTDRQRAWAAVLSAGPGAHLSADVALIEHGMKLATPQVLHVVTSTQRQASRRWFPDVDGKVAFRVEPHRSDHLAQWAHPVHDPPVLRVGPALLHAVSWAVNDRQAEWRLAAGVQQRLIRVADLRQTLEQMPRLRRRALVCTVLDDVELGAHAASELDFLRFLRKHGLPLPDTLQRPVRHATQRYLDAWWERQRVTAEIDGAHHRSVGAWDADVLRANDVVIAEQHKRLILLRFTAGNLRHDGSRVAAQLREVLL